MFRPQGPVCWTSVHLLYHAPAWFAEVVAGCSNAEIIGFSKIMFSSSIMEHVVMLQRWVLPGAGLPSMTMTIVILTWFEKLDKKIKNSFTDLQG